MFYMFLNVLNSTAEAASPCPTLINGSLPLDRILNLFRAPAILKVYFSKIHVYHPIFVLRLLSCFQQVSHKNYLPTLYMYCNFSDVTALTALRSHAWNETNLMHYVYSIYSVAILLHVLGWLVAHHQEVTISNKWYMLYVLVDCQLASWQSTKTYIEIHGQQNIKLPSNLNHAVDPS
jgi:hypothetical protein